MSDPATSLRRSAFSITATVLLTVAGAALLWLARDVILLGFLAVLIAVVFSFPVNALARVIGRGASVVLVLLLVVGAIAGFAVVAVPVLADEGRQVVETIPDALDRARTLLRREARKTGGAVGTPEKVTKTVQEQAESAGKAALSQVIPVALTTAEVLVTAVLVLVLAAFLVHAPDDYQRALRTLVPREHEASFDAALDPPRPRAPPLGRGDPRLDALDGRLHRDRPRGGGDPRLAAARAAHLLRHLRPVPRRDRERGARPARRALDVVRRSCSSPRGSTSGCTSSRATSCNRW